MKKDEFFAQLRTAFAGMDEELIMDILGDYENHFIFLFFFMFRKEIVT